MKTGKYMNLFIIYCYTGRRLPKHSCILRKCMCNDDYKNTKSILFTFYAHLTKNGRRLWYNVPVRVLAANLTKDDFQNILTLKGNI